ncbi:MAG: hypothetical protein K2G69_08095 [Muribaculaceae bacterium]|nr:hypothetical protein [Muribaculaceae bacterium]
MLKKLSKFLFPISLAIIIMSIPSDAKAGNHEKTLGIGGGFCTYNHAGYGKMFFQYSFIPLVRIAPEIGYVFPHNNISGFEASVDVQFPFRIVGGFKFYPLAGITMNNWSYKESPRVTRAGFDVGGGFDLYFTSSLKMSIQSKYSFVKETKGVYLDLGIGYVF